MKTRFNYPTRILFGQGVVEDTGTEAKTLGAKRPLLVTDAGLTKTDLPARIQKILEGNGLAVSCFADISPNPSDAQVEAGTRIFRKAKCDSIVALGGGSPLDAAKAIAIRVNHKEPLEVYDDLIGGDAKITGKLPVIIAIPTTAGTGSEVSRSAVITIAAVDRKVVLFCPRLMPAVAMCDPELTYSLPPRVTAETGMDALSHNLEAYLSNGYHPMADAIALLGIRMVARHLPTAVEQARDVEARQEMMMASTMGAVAFQKGLGVIHSLAHPLSSVAGMGHGLANAIVMPHAIRFNGSAVPERVARVAEALGAKDHSAEGAARAVEALLQRIGLPAHLAAAGVKESMLPALVERAMQDGCHGSNPRPCKSADMEALFCAAM